MSNFGTAHINYDLRGRSVRGGMIMVLSNSFGILLKTGATVVLARLLAPADFGLLAMAVTVTAFAAMFGELGLSAATVQKAEINHHQVSFLFWINAAFGFVITLVIISLGPVVAWFYGDQRLSPVTMALGTTFIFGGLAVQHHAILQRQMRFLALGLVDLVSIGVGVTIAITAAVLGAGYWSLVIMEVAMASVAAIGKWVAFPWWPGKPRTDPSIKEMLSFGGNITAYNIVNYFARNADNILIGRFLGTAELGFYSKAYALLMLPISQIRTPLMNVGMPVLSKLLSDPERYKKYYINMLQLLAFITVPLATILGEYSHHVIILLLGPQWDHSAKIFRILSFTALIQPLVSTYGMVMMSSNQTYRFFKLGLFTSIIYLISFVLGLPWGTCGVALSYSITNYILLLPTLIYAFNYTPICVRDFFQSIRLPIFASALMLLTNKVVFFHCELLPDMLSFVIPSTLGALVYLSSYLILPGGKIVLENIKSSIGLIFTRTGYSD